MLAAVKKSILLEGKHFGRRGYVEEDQSGRRIWGNHTLQTEVGILGCEREKITFCSFSLPGNHFNAATKGTALGWDVLQPLKKYSRFMGKKKVPSSLHSTFLFQHII